MVFSLIGVFLGQVGWLIGVVFGTIAELINIVLLYKGSDFVLKEDKSILFLLFFFLRMIVAVVFFLLTIILDFKLHIPAFHNSIWGVVIGFAPTEIIVLIIVGKSKFSSEKEVK